MIFYALVAVAMLIALLLVLLIVAARQPDVMRVERSAVIIAPASAIFPRIDNLRNWQEWSPFQELDPAMTQTYDGPAEGVGATMAWSGNSKAGQGRMTVIESRPFELVRIKLEFLKPFKTTNTAEFTFKPEGEQTLITWAMVSPNPLMFKVMHTIMNMDKMIGRDFTRGLAKLKTLVETKSYS